MHSSFWTALDWIGRWKCNSHLNSKIEVDRLIFTEHLCWAAVMPQRYPSSQEPLQGDQSPLHIFLDPFQISQCTATDYVLNRTYRWMCEIPATMSDGEDESVCGVYGALWGLQHSRCPRHNRGLSAQWLFLNGSLSLISHSSFTMTPLFYSFL